MVPAAAPRPHLPESLCSVRLSALVCRDHVFANKGIGGTSSAVFSACADQLVPADADLVVVEFTQNEPDNVEFTESSRKAYEQLLRKVLKRPGAPAIIQLHHYAWWFTYGDGVQFGRYYRYGEGHLQFMANVSERGGVSVPGSRTHQ